MDLQLTDRHVLITGGSKGIGLACALGFLREGARVTLVSRSAAHLAAGAAQLAEALAGHGIDRADAGRRIASQPADLRDPAAAVAALDAAEAATGPVDVLVNSAGAARRYGADELTPQYWRDAMDNKYFTYIHMLDPVIKRMAARGAGVIVNVIGAGGKVAATTHLSGGAANAALMLVSAGLAAAYGRRGVRVNAVNPGATLTERLAEGLAVEARANGISVDEARRRISDGMPLGRIATPEEIADAVVFLASPRASYISGAIVAMDGAVTPMVV
ncbi:MAG: SDR family oxidoreductase [Lautropia sp.]